MTSHMGLKVTTFLEKSVTFFEGTMKFALEESLNEG